MSALKARLSASSRAGAWGDGESMRRPVLADDARDRARAAVSSTAADSANCRSSRCRTRGARAAPCARGAREKLIHDRVVELARLRLELLPIDRDFEGVGLGRLDGRPDPGQHRRPGAGIVALRAEDQERRAVHDQRVTSVFTHQMRQEVLICSCPRGARECYGHAAGSGGGGESPGRVAMEFSSSYWLPVQGSLFVHSPSALITRKECAGKVRSNTRTPLRPEVPRPGPGTSPPV